MIGSLALLIVSFVKLDSKWCSALVQRVSSFVLISHAIGVSDINCPFFARRHT